MTSPLNNPAIVQAMDSIQIIAEAVVGYRKKLIDGGFTVEVAEALAMAFHTKMMESIGSGMSRAAAARAGR